jgi:anthranilate 1,2-dioxygenase small subunit
MVRDRAAATRDCTVYEPRYLRHFINGVRVTAVEGRTIRAKASFLVVESVSDKEPYVHMVGQYFDTIVQSEAGLKLKERVCVFDNYRIYNSLVFPV